MNDRSDVQLLRDYADHRDEAAFREIVGRHADLVYSAALRQVESSAAASDLAQCVFTDLARKAGALTRGGARGGDAPSPDMAVTAPALAGWLHRATRYAALNHRRDTRRRHTNERQAMAQLLTDSEPAADWEQIRPALDEALDSLGDEDREALLLRFFKNQDFRAVGLALGVSDDTAQKRVSRAVERLREFFAKRKITIGAGSLGILLSANVVQSAPVGLAAAISAAALATTAVTTSTFIAATTKTIAMTTLQKTFVAATVAVLTGTGIYEARQAAQLREHVQALEQQQTPLAGQIQQLQAGYDKATNTIAYLEEELTRSQKNNSELPKLRGEVGVLRQQNAALHKVVSNRDSDIRQADVIRQTEMLKNYTEQKLNDAKQCVHAMKLFAEEHNQMSPTNFSEVAEYLGGDSNPVLASFKHFEIAYQGALNALTCNSNTVLIRGTDIWPTVGGSLVRVYGFADGHSDLATVYIMGGKNQEKGHAGAHLP